MNKHDVFDLDVQVKEANLVQPDSWLSEAVCTTFCTGTGNSFCC
ncbi:gallidermin family lantibiotic [Brevibacillus laterosporus]|nr:gallidermin family lantibiotic [Brevibacillus laterosporus]AYB39518.1 gallidermin family protein [Brevibacillus laterosporus]MCG7316355.1 gallidermin family lantibiotic [Brevibacillus laterosporus]